MQQSRIVQKTINSLSDVDKGFTPSPDSNEIPVVLIPKSSQVVQLSATIPSGPFVLWQQWDRDMGELSPGIIRFWPAWNRVSHIITRAPIIYHTPMKDCPTSDNVMVNVDMSIKFRIGPNVEEARTFVYQIGANRFNSLLTAECEEAMRTLINLITHDRVNDVRREIGSKMLSILNERCNRYGVEIMEVIITSISLPMELQQRLERISTIQTMIRDSQKIHESKIRTLKGEAEKEMEAIRRSNARKVQEITAERKRYEIEQRLIEERAKGESRVQEVEAMTKADVALKKAQGDEHVMKMVARKDAEALLKRTQLECQTLKIEAEQNAIIMVKESEAQLKVTEAQAEALIARAQAEAESSENLSEKRKYELEWARLKVLEKLASKGRRFITGDLGEALLNQLVPLYTNEN